MSHKRGDFIICPYCDSVHEDMCDYPEGVSLGNQISMECWECGKSFDVIAHSSWTFNTYKKELKEKQNETKTKLTLKE